MILIITHKEDFTVDFVVDKLNKKNISYFRLNCEDIHKDFYNFKNEDGFNFTINGISNFDSVWFRRTKLPDLDINDEAEKLFLLGDYETLFDNIYALTDTKKWLSNPKEIYIAENKIFQLKIAKSIGFKIPNTLVTNSHKELCHFFEQNGCNVIIKPIRQGRLVGKDGFKTIFTNKLDLEIIQKLTEFDLTPCIYQEYINKQYEIRVTVVNDKVFAGKVNSQSREDTSIDWRKEKIPFERYDLPVEVENKCKLITNKLNLSFGAIDLIKTEDGGYVFLEINPNGQWAWLEMEAGLQISDEIINFLT
ncbi:hypothetical protein [Flavobacterium nitrogenifigens]|uniref:Glutathione synthase/RimK-type ligase, ATP-grasp superfamily n=1 Tax=Flavobacterium nitrogenifigens TaxID=1617283 RepID=A0A521AFS0_9FLAO|nr:hypothetical protein [Flavobacterium nitrogenifigens]KAF2331499.1 hypothetical protein DM397_12240 [Flavobacterium nitrogenifigens]SMO33649.1 Glutathione synthase/RimK-type ligase, ATP-grasp superfamily [Flavobacterium nitrogenifigens]